MLALSKRSRLRRLRSMMRGYRLLMRSDNLGLIRRIRAALVDARLDYPGHGGSRFMLGVGSAHAELVARQYVLAWIGGLRLERALMFSLGSEGRAVVFPLPKAWRDILTEHGFVVARRRCALAWAGFIALFWVYGVLVIMKHLALMVHTKFRRGTPSRGRYAYFGKLTTANLPQPGRDGRSHDVFTWYAHWSGRAQGLQSLGHGVRGAERAVAEGLPVRFVGDAIPPLTSLAGQLRFTGWAIGAVIRSSFDAMRGRWRHALMLRESAVAATVRLLETESLARDYLIKNSAPMYRPLWTYDAEERGSRILFYFYSTSEQPKLPTGYESDRWDWGPMNWPSYLVWDDYHGNLVRRVIDNDARVEIVGPIWFETGNVELAEIPSHSVAVFDVQPHRRSTRFAFSTTGDLSFESPRQENQFLVDIDVVLREHGIAMVLKQKRPIGNLVNRKYAALVRQLEKDGVIVVDPSTSPIRVIESCNAVISYWFTSTAILGREQGKPSIYYDPLGVIQKDDRAAHGIEVVSGIEELRAWVARVLGRGEGAQETRL